MKLNKENVNLPREDFIFAVALSGLKLAFCRLSKVAVSIGTPTKK